MITRVAVVVPAANEQDEIGRCLDSIAVARRQLDRHTAGLVSSDVVVVLDDCTDGTAGIVASAGVTAVHVRGRSVGAARRAGVTASLAAGAVPARQLWLAHTDADSEVPAGWLVAMLRAAEPGGPDPAAGADLVLGTVHPRRDGSADVHRGWDLEYDSTDGHPHVHGANLGIRAGLYTELGGWRDLQCHEDVDLVERAIAARARIVRTGTNPVLTSSRTVGRVEHGFAGYLRGLEQRTQVPDLLS